MELCGCPLDHVTADVREVVDLIGWAEQGILPEATGVNGQTRAFMDALAFWRAEVSRIEADRRKKR